MPEKRDESIVEAWVICPDNHTEGLSEPIAAFTRESEARAAMQLLDSAYQSYRLCKVPLWSSMVAGAVPDEAG